MLRTSFSILMVLSLIFLSGCNGCEPEEAQDKKSRTICEDGCPDNSVCIAGVCVVQSQDAGQSHNITDVGILDAGLYDAGHDIFAGVDGGEDIVLPIGGCLTGYNHCGEDQFCFINGCGDGLLGECVDVPEVEDCENVAPWILCGCDGVTYFSTCEAQRNRVNIAGPNACPTLPGADGGTIPITEFNCSVATDCDPDEFDNGEGYCVSDVCADGYRKVSLYRAPTAEGAMPADCFGPFPTTACLPDAVFEDDCPEGQHDNGTGECEYDCRPNCGHSFSTNIFTGTQYEPQYCHNAYKNIKIDGNDGGVASYCMPKYGNGCKPELGEYCMGGCEGRGFCRPANNEGECSMSDLVCTCSSDGMVASTGTRCTVNRKNVDTYGACEDWQPTPQDCGGPNDVTCPEGQKCNIVGCSDNAWGQCIDTPIPGDPCSFGCLSGGIFGNPECGCDGTTYSSACQRRQAGIAQDPTGSCTDTDTPQEGNSCDPNDLNSCDDSSPTYCIGPGVDGGYIFDQMECTPSLIQSQNGCPPGLNCWQQYPKTLFCKRPFGNCEGTTGTCTHWPGSDILGCSLYGEVISCGCDGVTYSHECYAYIEEVGIAHYQECEVIDAGQSLIDAGNATNDNAGQTLIDAGNHSPPSVTDAGNNTGQSLIDSGNSNNISSADSGAP